MNCWKRSLLLLAALFVTAVPVRAQTTTVIIVRHAEKVDDSADPALSEVGVARAQALAHALADAGVDAVYTTQYQRTRDTAAPLAEKLGITPVVIAPARGGAAHAAEIASRVREQDSGRTVLIVGHSNTVPLIVQALGGPDIGSIADEEYDNMFVLQLTPAGTKTLRAKFH